MEVFFGAIRATIVAGTVIALPALGELLAERSGVVNLGLEGIMAMGAIVAVITVDSIPSAYVGLLSGVLAGALLGLVFALTTVRIKANQILVGLALALLGSGLAAQIGSPYSGEPSRAVFKPLRIPLLADIPHVGNAFFNHDIVVYVTYLMLPALIAYVLFKTRHGMYTRAVGENPAAADAAGIRVEALRFLYVCVGGGLAGAGGAYITLGFTPAWSEGVTAGAGWIAIALVIFGAWRPLLVVLGSLLFGGVTSLGFVAQSEGWGINPTLLSTLPYLTTIVLLILPNIRRGQRRLYGRAPAALGLPYIREER